MMSYLRRYFISGLLVWLPILVTVWVVKLLVDLLENTMLLIPKHYQPDTLIGFHIPRIGLIITLALILGTGMVAANFMGLKLVALWDGIINRIPVIRTVHAGVKQTLETLFKPDGESFRKVFLVEYPREGCWTIAFQTGEGTPEVNHSLGDEPMLSLYVPTTPNPTSGFLLVVPRKKAVELKMSVEQALKFVISLGVMQPDNGQNKSLKKT